MKTTIKYITAVTMVAGFMVAGCNDKEKEMQERNAAIAQNTETVSARVRDSVENVFVQTLWEIDRNLELVQEKQGNIAIANKEPKEKGVSPKESVMRNIQVINSLMEENKKKLAELTKQVKKGKISNANMVKLMEETKKRLSAQEEEIAALKSSIAQKENDLAVMQQKMMETETKTQMLQDLSDKYENDINTAYYTFGTYKELKKEGVLNANTDFWSFKKSEKINDRLPEGNFTKIDIRQVKSIPINAKKVKLLTNHPSSSYDLKKDGDKIASLEIKDPEQFWKISKYLVLEVK